MTLCIRMINIRSLSISIGMKINTILGIAATLFATTLATTTLTAQAYDINAYNMGAKSDTDNMIPYTRETTFAPYYWNYATVDKKDSEVTHYRRMVPVIAGGRTITNVDVDDSFNGQYIYTSWRYYQERTGQTNYPTNAIWVNTPNGYGFYVSTTNNSVSPTTTQSVIIYIVSTDKQTYDPNGKKVVNLSDRNNSNNYSYNNNSWNNNLNDYYQSYNNYNRCRTVTGQDEWKQTSPNVWTRVPGATTTKCDDNYNSNNWNWYNNTNNSYNNSSSINSYSYSTPTWSIPSNYNSYNNYNGYHNGYYSPSIVERASEPTLRINYNTDSRAGKLVWNNAGSVQADEWKIFENGIQIAASRISGSNQSGEYHLSEARIGSEYRIELCKNDFCTTSKAVVSSGRY